MTGNRGGFAFICAVHEQIPRPVSQLRSVSIQRRRRSEVAKWRRRAVVSSPDTQKEAAKVVPLADQRKEFCAAFVAAPSCPENCEGSGRHPAAPTRATCGNVRQTEVTRIGRQSSETIAGREIPLSPAASGNRRTILRSRRRPRSARPLSIGTQREPPGAAATAECRGPSLIARHSPVGKSARPSLAQFHRLHQARAGIL